MFNFATHLVLVGYHNSQILFSSMLDVNETNYLHATEFIMLHICSNNSVDQSAFCNYFFLLKKSGFKGMALLGLCKVTWPGNYTLYIYI